MVKYSELRHVNNKKVQKLAIKSRKNLLVNEELLRDISEDELQQKQVESPPPLAPKVNKVIKKKKEENNVTALYFKRKLKIKNVRIQIFLNASKITENPEENLKRFKTLFTFLKESDPATQFTIFKITINSLCDVFCNIIPGYKIVEIDNSDENVVHKKEFKKLKGYETSLLKFYKHYLDELSSTLVFLWKDKSTKAEVLIKHDIAKVALKCMSSLLCNHYHFNFTSKIISYILPYGFHCNPIIRSIVTEALVNVFNKDIRGDTSLSIVKASLTIAERKQYNIPPEFLKVYLSLNLSLARKEGEKEHDIKKMREKLKMLSRQERKRKKRMQELEKELKETEAKESRDKKSYYQTEIMNQLFNLYFKILKSNSQTNLLAPVLEGLSKFALLINIEFFDDLMKLLNKILDEQQLSPDEILHCLIAVFSMLSGQGASLNIDPQKFYKHFYELIWKIPFVNGKTEALFKQCFDLMFIKRSNSLPLPRILAFVKRLTQVSLYCKYEFSFDVSNKLRGSFEKSQTINTFCLQLLRMHPQAECLVDFESDIGTGTYKPELEEPDFCNATSTHLYELMVLKKHVCKDVAKISEEMLKLKG